MTTPTSGWRADRPCRKAISRSARSTSGARCATTSGTTGRRASRAGSSCQRFLRKRICCHEMSQSRASSSPGRSSYLAPGGANRTWLSPGPIKSRPGPAKSGSTRPTRGNSRIEGTRPVRSGLRPPPSSLANLYRDETRAGFPYSFRGFAEVGCNTRRAGSAERAALSVPVSDLDFRGERLRRRLPRGCSVYATVATDGRSRSALRPPRP